MARWGLVYPWRCDAQGHAAQALARPYFASANDAEGPAMSREAFGDPPEQQEVPECCPNCGSDFYMPGCTHCEEVKRRCAAESEALAMRGVLHRMLEAPTTHIRPSWKDEIRATLGRRIAAF